MWIVQSNLIRGCPVSTEDAKIAYKIYGKNIAALKGKTTRKKPTPVAAGNLLKVPKETLNLHKEAFMLGDVFFVNGTPFFISLGLKLDFTGISHLADRKASTIFAAFKEIYRFYQRRGFKITMFNADGEFAPPQVLINDMANGPRVNLTSANEHAHGIERRIRVVKERARAIRHGMPFNKIPKLLTTHTVINAGRMLGFFPTKGGVSETLSPRTIMTGKILDYKKHLSLSASWTVLSSPQRRHPSE